MDIDFVLWVLNSRRNSLTGKEARDRGRTVLTATGSKTEFGKIANLIHEVKEAETPLQ